MSKSILGIEIGNSNIKIVHVVKRGMVEYLKNYGIIETPKDAVQDGYIRKYEEVYEAIHALIKEKGFKEKDVAYMVQGTSIITRDVMIPVLPNKEIEKLIAFQSDEYFPIDVSDYQTDFKVLDKVKTEEGEKLSILLVAAPNSIINPALDMMKDLNLKPKAIDIISNCISKAFIDLSISHDKEDVFSIMILDIGGQTTTVTILSEGSILFSRAILYGFSEMNMAIANEFDSSNMESVEIFKKKYAAIYEKDEILDNDIFGSYISTIIKPSIDNNLIREVSRFLDFYYSRNENKNRKIKNIYLVGGGSYLKNIDKFIEKKFNIPTCLGDSIKTIKADRLRDFENDFLYLLNAIGLANRL